MRRKVLSIWLAAVPALLCAQDPLPRAETILDRYVEVTGGREAYEKRRTELRKATAELKGRDLKLTLTIWRAEPNKSYSVTEIPGIGKVEEGTDGEVAWSISEARGPVIKEGFERDMALYAAALNSDLRWREFFTSAETAGLEEIQGRPCYKVLLRWGEANQQTRYYDKETGLLTRQTSKIVTPRGQLSSETSAYDYRRAGDILLPFGSRIVLGGQEIVGQLESVETNIEIEPSRRALPDAIKSLLAKQKAAQSEEPR